MYNFFSFKVICCANFVIATTWQLSTLKKKINKGIYLVSETSGFVSPFDKYHIVKGHFMISMLILWNMAPLIRVLILMFTSEFRVAECWIFKIFLMPQSFYKFWALQNIWFCCLFFFIYLLYVFTWIWFILEPWTWIYSFGSYASDILYTSIFPFQLVSYRLQLFCMD